MRKLDVALGIVVSLVCLILAVLGIDWPRVVGALRQADWRYLIPAGVALLAYLGTRSARWKVLLGSHVSLPRAFWVTNIGYLASNVLPLRLGDPARAVALGMNDDVRISAALSTVVVERVFDMLTVVAFLAATVPFVAQAGWTRKAGVLGAGLGLGAMGLLVLMANRPESVRRLAQRLMEGIPWLDGDRWLEWLDGTLDGVSALRSMERVGLLVGWSLLTWGFTVVHYLMMMRAFIGAPSVVAASFLTCATALGVAVPSSPGAVGVFHSVARYALQLPFGVPAETAVVVAFAAHAFQYVTMCGLGLLGLARLNLSFTGLRTQARAEVGRE